MTGTKISGVPEALRFPHPRPFKSDPCSVVGAGGLTLFFAPLGRENAAQGESVSACKQAACVQLRLTVLRNEMAIRAMVEKGAVSF